MLPGLTFEPVSVETAAPQREGHETFMLKEMREQPQTLARGLASALASAPLDAAFVARIDRILLVGCGSAFHAAQVARILIEEEARIPAEAVIASELRLTRPILTERSFVIAISQSGETADTLACVRQVKAAGARVLAVCNVATSAIARAADDCRLIACGTEIGVASTKAYTGMLLQLALIAAEIAEIRVASAQRSALVEAARALPGKVETALHSAIAVSKVLQATEGRRAFLFIGRHLHHATACEGALKLRELTYLNADAYAGGELKHGSIALIDKGYPVIAVAPRGPTSAKMISSIQEVRARGAHVIGIVTEGDEETAGVCDQILEIPETTLALTPILATLPLQVLAYELGKSLGRNLDRPRNLAKSVTVE